MEIKTRQLLGTVFIKNLNEKKNIFMKSLLLF
jgi:hypothetical protein